MWIKPLGPIVHERLVYSIQEWLNGSRFTATVGCERHPKYGACIKIECVRLRNGKPYCGQHPGPCQVNPFFEKKHRWGRWLEGADWIGFNDGLNGVLDSLGVSADIWSYNRESLANRYFIRKGPKRRTNYAIEAVVLSGGDTVYGWLERSEQFQDWRQQEAPPSDYPAGTPGIADWRPEAEAEHPELFLAHAH